MLGDGVYSSLGRYSSACLFATLAWKAATAKRFRIATSGGKRRFRRVLGGFVRKATVFPAWLTLSDKNCQGYATITKCAPGLCLPIATFSAAAAGVGKRQVTFVLPHGARLPGPNAFAARVQGGLDAHVWFAVCVFQTTYKAPNTSERRFLHASGSTNSCASRCLADEGSLGRFDHHDNDRHRCLQWVGRPRHSGSVGARVRGVRCRVLCLAAVDDHATADLSLARVFRGAPLPCRAPVA